MRLEPNHSPHLRRAFVAVLVAAASFAFSCIKGEKAPRVDDPLLVLGIDGADPGAIKRLLARGELPNFRALIERGTMETLETAFMMSPVIWTTMTTGFGPDEHGIDDFYTVGENGLIPISSATRSRPALWNMLDRVGKRGAFLGLWATWPAEPTRGLIVSDRLGSGLDSEVSPGERRDDLSRWLAKAVKGGIPFGGKPPFVVKDRVVTLAANQALSERTFDVVFAYLRSVDVTSHAYWHLFAPEEFPTGPPAEAPRSRTADPVADAYRAADLALGSLLQTLPEKASVLVVSDHGFIAHTDSPQVKVDFDRVLEALGYLARRGDGNVDRERSQAWTERTPHWDWVKRVRVSPELAPDARREILAAIPRSVAECRFSTGIPAFYALPVPAAESEKGIDLEFALRGSDATRTLSCEGREVANSVVDFEYVTGGHLNDTHGILIAAGPIFRRQDPNGVRVSIFDVAPTILYALGLPVGRDFAGRVAFELFEPEFVTKNPERQIASWGRRVSGQTLETQQDAELLDELASLGYLR